MSKIVIRLPKGSGELPAGSTGRDLIDKIGTGLAKDVLSSGFGGPGIVDIDAPLLKADEDELLILSYYVNSQGWVTNWVWRKLAPWGVSSYRIASSVVCEAPCRLAASGCCAEDESAGSNHRRSGTFLGFGATQS